MRIAKLVGRKCLLSLLCVFALGIVLAGCGSDKVKMGTAPQEQESPLFNAIAAGDLATVQAEISRDPSLLNQTEGGFVQTPLHKAVRSKQLEIVRYLIDSGAELNTMDVLGRTPLSAAMDEEAGDEIVKLLQDNGAED